MARTALVLTVAPGPYPVAGVAVTFAAINAVDGSKFTMTGQELLLARNTHATDAQTVTVSSAACSHGRTLDITTESIAAGVTHIFGPFKRKEGWAQTDNTLHVQGSTVDITLAVIQLPNIV